MLVLLFILFVILQPLLAGMMTAQPASSIMLFFAAIAAALLIGVVLMSFPSSCKLVLRDIAFLMRSFAPDALVRVNFETQASAFARSSAMPLNEGQHLKYPVDAPYKEFAWTQGTCQPQSLTMSNLCHLCGSAAAPPKMPPLDPFFVSSCCSIQHPTFGTSEHGEHLFTFNARLCASRVPYDVRRPVSDSIRLNAQVVAQALIQDSTKSLFSRGSGIGKMGLSYAAPGSELLQKSLEGDTAVAVFFKTRAFTDIANVIPNFTWDTRTSSKERSEDTSDVQTSKDENTSMRSEDSRDGESSSSPYTPVPKSYHTGLENATSSAVRFNAIMQHKVLPNTTDIEHTLVLQSPVDRGHITRAHFKLLEPEIKPYDVGIFGANEPVTSTPARKIISASVTFTFGQTLVTPTHANSLKLILTHTSERPAIIDSSKEVVTTQIMQHPPSDESLKKLSIDPEASKAKLSTEHRLIMKGINGRSLNVKLKPRAAARLAVYDYNEGNIVVISLLAHRLL